MSYFVNDVEITEEDIKSEMEKMRPQYEQTFADMGQDEREKQLYEWSKENIIEQTLLREAAGKKFPNISQQEIKAAGERHRLSDKEIKQFKEQIKSQVQVDKLVESLTSALGEPSEKEIEKFYRQNADRFTVPEMIRAAHIVRHPNPAISPEEQKKELETILERIRGGEDFGKVASESSDCADAGGDLGYFSRGKMVEEFEDVVFGMDVGQVSDVFQTQFGWHISKVLDRKPQMLCPLEQVRDIIVKELKQQKSQKAIEKFLDEAKAKAKIEER